ncbi:MAG: hypothetical protein ACTSRU_14320 [Candidatus Hodarchaeales archaeon]
MTPGADENGIRGQRSTPFSEVRPVIICLSKNVQKIEDLSNKLRKAIRNRELLTEEDEAEILEVEKMLKRCVDLRS